MTSSPPTARAHPHPPVCQPQSNSHNQNAISRSDPLPHLDLPSCSHHPLPTDPSLPKLPALSATATATASLPSNPPLVSTPPTTATTTAPSIPTHSSAGSPPTSYLLTTTPIPAPPVVAAAAAAAAVAPSTPSRKSAAVLLRGESISLARRAAVTAKKRREEARAELERQGIREGVETALEGLVGASASTRANVSQNKTKRLKRVKWHAEEVVALRAGVKKYGEGRWAVILREFAASFHPVRISVDLKDKWRNLFKSGKARVQPSDDRLTEDPTPQLQTAMLGEGARRAGQEKLSQHLQAQHHAMQQARARAVAVSPMELPVSDERLRAAEDRLHPADEALSSHSNLQHNLSPHAAIQNPSHTRSQPATNHCDLHVQTSLPEEHMQLSNVSQPYPHPSTAQSHTHNAQSLAQHGQLLTTIAHPPPPQMHIEHPSDSHMHPDAQLHTAHDQEHTVHRHHDDGHQKHSQPEQSFEQAPDHHDQPHVQYEEEAHDSAGLKTDAPHEQHVPIHHEQESYPPEHVQPHPPPYTDHGDEEVRPHENQITTSAELVQQQHYSLQDSAQHEAAAVPFEHPDQQEVDVPSGLGAEQDAQQLEQNTEEDNRHGIEDEAIVPNVDEEAHLSNEVHRTSNSHSNEVEQTEDSANLADMDHAQMTETEHDIGVDAHQTSVESVAEVLTVQSIMTGEVGRNITVNQDVIERIVVPNIAEGLEERRTESGGVNDAEVADTAVVDIEQQCGAGNDSNEAESLVGNKKSISNEEFDNEDSDHEGERSNEAVVVSHEDAMVLVGKRESIVTEQAEPSLEEDKADIDEIDSKMDENKGQKRRHEEMEKGSIEKDPEEGSTKNVGSGEDEMTGSLEEGDIVEFGGTSSDRKVSRDVSTKYMQRR